LNKVLTLFLFSFVRQFVMHPQLASPKFIAEKIYSIIQSPNDYADIWQKLQ